MNMELTDQEKNLYRAVAELAFAITTADDEVTPDEVSAFKQAIRESLGKGEWMAGHHFDARLHNEHFDLEASYQRALNLIEENYQALDSVLIRKFLYVLEKTAEVRGISEEEQAVISRFEQDILNIHTKNGLERNLKISPQLSNLYSTIGQLAYVIAMADHVLMEEERIVFRQVIKRNLGDFDWLADDRFQVIDEIMVLDLDSTYDHVLYLIRKNSSALDKTMIDKFLDVIVEVAKVAGITPEEQLIIERFRRDVYKIYHEKPAV